MKNRFTPLFISALGVGAVALLSQNAQSQSLVYDDTATYEGANFNFDSGQAGSVMAGNEVVLGLGSPLASASTFVVSQFQVQIDFTGTGTPTGTVDVSFYDNNGATYNGYPTPGSIITDLGSSALTTFSTGGGETLTYTVPDVTVPKDFTYIVTFNGLTSTETAGLSIYGTPTYGQNYEDAWVNTGSGYTLEQATGSEPALQFGATVTATPEPSTIVLGVMGACAFLARRRKS